MSLSPSRAAPMIVALLLIASPVDAEPNELVEIEAGGGASYTLADSVGAPAISVRAGIPIHSFDLSARFVGIFGGTSTFNPDCCSGQDAYHAFTGLLEAGYKPTAIPFRFFAGFGLSSITVLANRAAHLAGTSGHAPTFSAGLAPVLWSIGRLVVSIQVEGTLWTGIGVPGNVDRFGHDSSAFGLSALVTFRYGT